ncbi:MAG: response regulator [Candidatus Heimdallarchaeota archaeon]|nr:response regulator [Candidatus Heimdallarchaeota archaeon]MCK5047820.1 response regulator [Candidatus Heimdallarchaeota archaeon]
MESDSLNILSALVIESSDLFQRKLKSMLKNAGIKITGLLTGSDRAVELMLSSNPDLVILDISLPKDDAFSLLIAFSHHSPNTPVIVSYSTHELPAVYSALSIGATSSIVKPFNQDEFFLVLQELFPKQSFACSSLVNLHLKLLSNFIKQLIFHASEEFTTKIYLIVNDYVTNYQVNFDFYLMFDPWRGEFKLKESTDEYISDIAEVQLLIIEEMFRECVIIEGAKIATSLFSEAYNAFFWGNERFVNVIGFPLPYHLTNLKRSHTQLPFYVEHFYLVSLDGRKMVHYSRQDIDTSDESDHLFSSMLTAISQLSEETSFKANSSIPRRGLQKIEESGQIIFIFRGIKSRAFIVVNREIPGLGIICEQIVREFEEKYNSEIDSWVRLSVFDGFNSILKKRIDQLEGPYQFID